MFVWPQHAWHTTMLTTAGTDACVQFAECVAQQCVCTHDQAAHQAVLQGRRTFDLDVQLIEMCFPVWSVRSTPTGLKCEWQVSGKSHCKLYWSACRNTAQANLPGTIWLCQTLCGNAAMLCFVMLQEQIWPVLCKSSLKTWWKADNLPCRSSHTLKYLEKDQAPNSVQPAYWKCRWVAVQETPMWL